MWAVLHISVKHWHGTHCGVTTLTLFSTIDSNWVQYYEFSDLWKHTNICGVKKCSRRCAQVKSMTAPWIKPKSQKYFTASFLIYCLISWGSSALRRFSSEKMRRFLHQKHTSPDLNIVITRYYTHSHKHTQNNNADPERWVRNRVVTPLNNWFYPMTWDFSWRYEKNLGSQTQKSEPIWTSLPGAQWWPPQRGI